MWGLADMSLANLEDRGAEISPSATEETARWAQNMRNVAADWASEIDIRDMPGCSMLTMWVAEFNSTCGAPPGL